MVQATFTTRSLTSRAPRTLISAIAAIVLCSVVFEPQDAEAHRRRPRRKARVTRVEHRTSTAPPHESAAGEQRRSPTSRSVGHSNRGHLVNASRLRESDALALRFPENAWGTRETVEHISRCAASVRRTFKTVPKLLVGDISRKRGGSFKPHENHQSGRDADIGFFLARGRTLPGLWRVSARDIDAPRTWSFIDCLRDTGELQVVFLDRRLQRPLYDYVKSEGASKQELAEIFEYPRKPGTRVGLIQHRKNHDNHLHVRFRCPKSSPECIDEPWQAEGPRRGASIATN